MVRTQLHLTDNQRKGLAALARSTGKKQADLIREAVDRLISQFNVGRRNAALDRAAGMWANRDDLPDFDALRQELDRG